jgi:hypothetical protein
MRRRRRVRDHRTYTERRDGGCRAQCWPACVSTLRAPRHDRNDTIPQCSTAEPGWRSPSSPVAMSGEDGNPPRIARCLGFRRVRVSPPLRRAVCDTKLLGDPREGRMRRPQRYSFDQRRCQEVCIDPSDAGSVELPIPHERDDLGVCHASSLMHLRVDPKKLRPSTAITHEQFTVDELVAEHLVRGQDPIERAGVRFLPREKPDSHRRVDQHHGGRRKENAWHTGLWRFCP